MSSRRKVINIDLHSEVRMGGRTEKAINDKKFPGAMIEIQPGEGAYVIYKGEEFYVPEAHFKSAKMAPVTPEKSKT